jgi:hypothetical protein
MNELRQTPSDQDFVAALHEIKSNLDVRRLMFVLSNVLIPALGIAMIDALTGSTYPEPLRWLPLSILPLVGAILALAGTLVTSILTRCHYGLVLNSAKMSRVETGELQLAGLNWLGVTTNFVALTALYAGAGLSLLLTAFGLGTWALAAGAGLFIVLMSVLRWNHGRASRRAQELAASWQPGVVSLRYREEHARESLEATTSDISVIVVMAVALFSGTFNCMANLGSISAELAIRPAIDSIQTWGLPLLSGFTLLALLLSDRMVVRLRIALAQHAQKLAELRNEPDEPWRFRPQERTYLLFILLHLLTSAAMLILAWSLAGRWAGLGAGAALLLVGLAWYPWQLAQARPRAVKRALQAS